jgi:hypothetical protein
MHHSIKDHHLFGCTKHIIKLELWFVCVREHTLYGFFHKLSTKNGVKIFHGVDFQTIAITSKNALKWSSWYFLPTK